MKKAVTVMLLLFCGFITVAQPEIEKIKTKHFSGTWYSKEDVMECKDQSILVFYRTPPPELKDSIRTTFNIRKDDVRIDRYNKNLVGLCKGIT